MGFQYETDTAADVADFFANLEALLVAAGWVLVGGGGTTDIVYRSTGELGTLTKLFIRVWQDGGTPQRVYFCVQDDGGATHSTGSGSVGYLTATGAGDAAFKYWITATKDMVIITFKAAGYSGCYIGITEPFALTLPDETYQMVSVGFHTDDGAQDRPYTRILHRYDDTWDYVCYVEECTHEYNPNPLDGSHALFGGYVCTSSSYREHYGQLLYATGRIKAGTGINAEDTITSGYPGATSEWIIFGAGDLRWAVATSAPLPLGVPDGANWAYTTGVAGDITALQTALNTFLTARGWTVADRVPKIHAEDKTFNSPGESGLQDIWIRWRWDAPQTFWGGSVMDGIAEAHMTSYVTPGADRIEPGDWPVRYYFTGDKDCFLVIVQLSGIFEWCWFGHCKSFFPDPDIIATEYMVGCLYDTTGHCLRTPTGAWAGSLNEFVEPCYVNSSPNRIDGTTFTLWPYTMYASGEVPWGTLQYLYRLSSLSISLGDTVQIGAHVFMYIGSNWAMKIA